MASARETVVVLDLVAGADMDPAMAATLAVAREMKVAAVPAVAVAVRITTRFLMPGR